jgi:seryl-tRNA synthetase
LQAEHRRTLFEIEELEDEVRAIKEQLEGAEFSQDPNKKEGSAWWYRANDALRHKKKRRRVLVARADRIQRKLNRIQPDEKKAEAKAKLKEVMKTLLLVARTSLDYYEDDSEDNEDAFTTALDRLDVVVPGWDGERDVDREVSTG